MSSSASPNPFSRLSLQEHAEPPPPIKARFFYSSSLPIDDPLSPVPPPPASATTPARLPPKPFSTYDNEALEKAWLGLRRDKAKTDDNINKVRAGSRHESAGNTGAAERRGSGSRPGTPRSAKALRPSSLSPANASPKDTELLPGSLDSTAVNPDVAHMSTTTGTPFIRAPSRKNVSALRKSEGRQKEGQQDMEEGTSAGEASPASKDAEAKQPSAKVAVGVSRLHQVEMPEMQMTPIYWTPVHDTAPVARATWFYQDTMMPVEPPVANMLEAGYLDLQVWTETWQDELNCAVEVGAVGEMKVLHKLWPDKPAPSGAPSSRRGTMDIDRRESLLRTAITNLAEGELETVEQRREKDLESARERIDAATGPNGPDNSAQGTFTYGRQGALRTYANWGVIYANGKEARLLKSTLMPSDYYRRRPLANYIRKGYKLGIPVIRGFDQKAWDKLYPPKQSTTTTQAQRGTATSSSSAPPNRRQKTDPEFAKAERPKVTDLVFVIHGIGQKLSQRMESFHFTHAINAFRRDINVEVGSRETKARFRKDMGGIMVLPINWRHALSFEDGGYQEGPEEGADKNFTLSDITPETLPSVRGIVSDVMLDIPYYMSHHQPKMIAAVISEANRVYQLWCLNNPGFAKHGRVHIIAHSLGSVMAMDILSHQPTTIPEHLADPTTVKLDTAQLDHFLFDTSNLFLAGSPAGFFLLLHKARLLPRLDRPSTDPATNIPAVCGRQGQYGCLAVTNLYNVLNPYDPVAYRMNAAVDAAYAAALRPALIPSATPGWFGVGTKAANFYNPTRRNNSTHPSSTNLPSHNTPDLSRPQPTARLPSNVEMETHDFSREELAEQRMHLLNDNGQIDFWLRYGGGVFEIQYLTMLGAHSSYWLLKDFVRLVVTEVGREGGREGAFLGMRPVRRKAGAGGG